MLTYIVTFRCNANCVMCDSWKKNGHDDLSPEELERALLEVPRLDVVRLSGGETFIRRDLLQLTEVLLRRTRPALLHVTTNGSYTERIVEFCEQRPRTTPLELLISVDAVDDQHDEIRGRAGSYRWAMESLGALVERQRELNLTLAVNQTVLGSDNAGSYPSLRARMAELGVRHQVVFSYQESATYSEQTAGSRATAISPAGSDSIETFGAIGTADAQHLLDQVELDARRWPSARGARLAKRYYLGGARNRLLRRTGKPNPPCVAVGAHLRLNPNGDVPICQFNNQSIGNLREIGFNELWRSTAAHGAREWVRACPGCWAECEVVPSAVYSGDILRALF